jgi:hypothetical protein
MSNMARSGDPVEGGWRVALHALAVLLITSIHHVYGAIVYHTPWRYHAVHVSVATALVMLGALALVRARAGTMLARVAWWTFVLVTAAVPILMIGGFEGVYNHLVKNVVYFGGAPTEWLTRLFPPPKYEMPNNLFFEVTGILQIVPAVSAAWLLARLSASPANAASASSR